jgi:hypothetical protein
MVKKAIEGTISRIATRGGLQIDVAGKCRQGGRDSGGGRRHGSSRTVASMKRIYLLRERKKQETQ